MKLPHQAKSFKMYHLFFPLAEYSVSLCNLLLQLIYIDRYSFYIIVLLFNILRIIYRNMYLYHFNLPSPFQLLHVPLTTFEIHDTVPLFIIVTHMHIRDIYVYT